MAKLVCALLLLALTCIFAACDARTGTSATPFNGIDITGADYGKDFALTDHNGKPRTLADFKGKAVLMFFGFTHCPDVCPATLSDLAQVMKQLGPDAQRLQVIFVTVDPERDTAQLLAQYVPSFHPSFLGLYGDAAATKKTAQVFRVFYEKGRSDKPGNYSVDHTAGTYAFDPQGRLRLFLSQGLSADKITQDVKRLLAS
jgi:protein SCO1